MDGADWLANLTLWLKSTAEYTEIAEKYIKISVFLASSAVKE